MTLHHHHDDEVRETLELAKTVTFTGGRAIALRHKGPQASAKREVTAAGDILLKVGPAGSEVADTTIGLPTLNGTIDVSDASANSWKKIEDNINASANWEMIRVGVLGSWKTDDVLATLAEGTGDVGKRSGEFLLLDSTKLLFSHGGSDYYALVQAIGHEETTTSKHLDDRLSDPRVTQKRRKKNTLSYIKANATFAAGSSAFFVFAENKAGTIRTLINGFAGAATTVDFEWPGANPAGQEITAELGEKMVVAYAITGGAPSAGTLKLVQGRSKRRGFVPFTPATK